MSAEADAPKPMKPLAAAETAVRRFLLMVGFGFMAFVAGSILGASLQNRLVPRLEGAGPFLGIVTFFLVQGLWVMIVLPAFSHIAARFLELKPWSTAVIGAGTGMLFQLALQYVSVGAEGIAGAPTQQALRLLGIGTGIVLTAIAVKRGRELARVAEERAKVEAEKKKHQYDEFVKQAEALADRREQVPIAAAAPVDPAGVEAPGAPAPTPEPAPTGLPPKP
ncbi:MAG: hypothetical protein JNK82_18505 [Myxococcaceae bacterium]|nr:hypothetical protein [Myxococcaceae bacterium]